MSGDTAVVEKANATWFNAGIQSYVKLLDKEAFIVLIELKTPPLILYLMHFLCVLWILY